MRRIHKDDRVICSESGVIGTVVGFYVPTSCEEQTMVITEDGRRYHAPTRTWSLYKDGLSAVCICDALTTTNLSPLIREVVQIRIGDDKVSTYKEELRDQIRDEIIVAIEKAIYSNFGVNSKMLR
jgi:hypothetical protein